MGSDSAIPLEPLWRGPSQISDWRLGEWNTQIFGHVWFPGGGMADDRAARRLDALSDLPSWLLERRGDCQLSSCQSRYGCP